MLKNYLKTAVRTLWRDRRFAAINVSGLAVGMAVCLLMLLFVRQHWRKDRFHAGADRIHRVTTVLPDGKHFAAAPPPVGPALERRGAGVESVARLWQSAGALLRHGQDRFEERYLYADSSFFNVFDGFELARGSEALALAEPNTAVLTPQMARKLFGEKDPVGQTITLEAAGVDEAREVMVTGVLEKRPSDEPTHLGFEALFSSATVDNDDQWVFGDRWKGLSRNYTYLLLEKGARSSNVESHLANIAERFYPSERERYQFRLQSLSDIALNRAASPSWNTIYGSMSLDAFLAYLLVGLGLVVLLAAGFNYVNLTVARSLRRAKEVGVRKTIGARREQVAGQFLAESVLLALIATVGAALLLKGFVPAFKNLYAMRFLDPGLTFDLTAEPSVAVLLLGFGTAVGLLAGAYPAWVLSRPQAADVLGAGSTSSGSLWKGFWRVRLRKGLVGLQIVFALVLTISTALLYRQAQTFRSADHGFETEQVFSLSLDDVSYPAFKQQSQQVPGVADVTGVENLFMGGNHDFRALTRPARYGDTLKVDYFATDSTYAQAVNLNLVARLPELGELYASGAAVILNEQATDGLGFEGPRSALGQRVKMDTTGTYTVAAVARDVWFEGRDERRIKPFALRYHPEEIEHALVHVAEGTDTRTVMDAVETVWTTLGSVYPYTPRSYAEFKQNTYGPYRDLALIAGSVALVALIIVCIGLAALAAYVAQTRVKEIGVRKALGASEWSVVRQLTTGYAWLVVGAAVLGVPLAWALAAQLWQPLFSRPLDPTAGIFAGSVAALGTLVLAVVGWQAWRAACISPVEALRDE